MEYRRGAHTVFEIHLHLVWITKYRRPALTGEIARHFAGLRPEQGLQPVTRATALRRWFVTPIQVIDPGKATVGFIQSFGVNLYSLLF